MLTPSLIRISQNRIERTLTDLCKEISNYERLQNNIRTNLDRLNNIKSTPNIDITSAQTMEVISTLKDANTLMSETSHRVLREIDSMVSVIAGYMSVLIEECIENYSAKLKVWIRIRLNQLDELRIIKIHDATSSIAFPSAVAMLTPYIIKTRMHDQELSNKFISIRNLIRSLSEPSY